MSKSHIPISDQEDTADRPSAVEGCLSTLSQPAEWKSALDAVRSNDDAGFREGFRRLREVMPQIPATESISAALALLHHEHTTRRLVGVWLLDRVSLVTTDDSSFEAIVVGLGRCIREAQQTGEKLRSQREETARKPETLGNLEKLIGEATKVLNAITDLRKSRQNEWNTLGTSPQQADTVAQTVDRGSRQPGSSQVSRADVCEPLTQDEEAAKMAVLDTQDQDSDPFPVARLSTEEEPTAIDQPPEKEVGERPPTAADKAVIARMRDQSMEALQEC